jgi:hypothetical protein
VRHWLKRFNARGLDGLEEDGRTGRPPTYSAAQRSAVIDAALTHPADLGGEESRVSFGSKPAK